MTRCKHISRTPVAAVLMAIGTVAPAFSADPIAIGNRLELFVDDYLIGEIQGDVRQQLLRPEPKEVDFVADRPWEGNTSGYYTYFRDSDCSSITRWVQAAR